MSKVGISINTKEFQAMMRSVAGKQVPFAMAKALTDTAKGAQKALKYTIKGNMTLRNKHTERGIRLVRAEKKDGLSGMSAKVRSIDWYMQDQTDGVGSVRKPKSATYKYIPVKARPNKNRSVPKRLRIKEIVNKNQSFYRRGKNQSLLVFQRYGKKKKRTRLLYVAVKSQKIKSRVSVDKVILPYVKRNLGRNFTKAWAFALKTAR